MRRKSFHSTQAASQALQPMQVVVSMYLETVAAVRMPDRLPRTEAEERRISRFWLMIVLLSRFLDPDQERLELRRPGIRVHCRRSQQVGERTGVFRVPRIAPVDRESDLPGLLPVLSHGIEPLGDAGSPLG